MGQMTWHFRSFDYIYVFFLIQWMVLYRRVLGDKTIKVNELGFVTVCLAEELVLQVGEISVWIGCGRNWRRGN